MMNTYFETVADELANIVGVGLGGPAHDESIANVDDLAVIMNVAACVSVD
jgi:hypothetical protein